ncbi:hypothetical protein EI94DRAFT_1807771 [Lactarius quietus]|nr:hypothetical protein EI94DRAFT_1807771 [Lactarius quietus]
MSLSLPFGVGNSVDNSSGMENTYHFDAPSRWQSNGADPTADPSIYARPQYPLTSGGVWSICAPEALIEQNAFYLQLKLTLGQCNQEIATIKAASVSQKKEFEDLKARYETLDKSHTTMIKEFAQEYHTMKAGGGDGANQTLTLTGVLPYPETSTHEEKPEVVHWIKEGFVRWLSAQPKGEMDSNAAIIPSKPKAGRPRKSTDKDDTESSGPKHAYLKREDGTPISADEHRLLSQTARAVWTTLISYNQAPKMWGKLSNWKLKEWSKHHYSGWALNNGLREPRPPKKEAKEDTGSPSQDPLDDKGLFQIEPSTGEEPEETLHSADHVNSTDDRGQEQDNSDMGMSDREGDIAIPGASTARNTHISAKPATVEITQAKSIVVNPLCARPLARPVAKPVTDTIAPRMPNAVSDAIAVSHS